MGNRAYLVSAILIALWIFGISILAFNDLKTQKNYLNDAGMILIEGGCFEMGNSLKTGREDDTPVHMVCVDPFYIGKEMVTVRLFRQFINDTRYKTDGEKNGGCEGWDGDQFRKIKDRNWSNPGKPQRDTNSVVCVSWNDASRYTSWLQTKSPKRAMSFRLPTEAEWEFVARNRGNAAPIEDFSRGLILFPQTADLKEWLFDWYDQDYYRNGSVTNPLGPLTGKTRVLRDGPSLADPVKNKVFLRFSKEPGYVSDGVGFRIVLPLSDR